MQTEREKMLSGELYDPLDPQLVEERRRARLLCKALNETSEDELDERAHILRELIPNAGTDPWIQPPFYCDYGSNITLGDKVFFNFNCVVLDVAPVSIGSYVLFGPAVQLYTATHPLRASERRKRLEGGKPLWIEEDVWLGGGVVVLPGVRIGRIAGILTDQDARRSRVLASFSLRSGAQVPTYVPLRCSRKPRQNPSLTGALALKISGMRIGRGAVIGAGSVVTKDVPEYVFAAGNPCRVVRELEP